MSTWKVSITYRTAEIIAGLLPAKHLNDEAMRAVIELLGEVIRTKKLIEDEEAEAEAARE
jgi:hypothetical protein